MSCAEMRVLLHGMLDRQLDLADAVRVETHMQTCHDCTAEYRRQEALRAAIRRPEPRYRAPHDLRARITASIRLQTDVLCQVPWWRGAVTGWLGTGVSLALAASLFFVVAMPGEQAIQQELISGHVRSLLASHLTDVTTSDEHTVKPWFNGKLARRLSTDRRSPRLHSQPRRRRFGFQARPACHQPVRLAGGGFERQRSHIDHPRRLQPVALDVLRDELLGRVGCQPRRIAPLRVGL
jgi:anti-sigma factor (TIGR02949 family)